MNKILALITLLFLTACSASIGQPPRTTSTTYVTPAEVSTTQTVPVTQTTTVERTTY